MRFKAVVEFVGTVPDGETEESMSDKFHAICEAGWDSVDPDDQLDVTIYVVDVGFVSD